ncbi:MAG: CDP-alcohol phosphatidyltransferase family protein [Omnitrophica bacterium]|nr:CDP-alcohol phosphatidyltransferase family protein [Candidatus Omnitrophota bacterium]
MSYSIGRIRKSFNACADEMPVTFRYILRPISVYVTFIVLKAKITNPNIATGTHLALGLASLALLISPEKTFFVSGAFLYILAYIFDFVDGNIARVTDSASYYGKFLDGTVDALLGALFPIVIGVHMYFTNNNWLFLLMGACVGFIVLFACYLLTRASFCNYWLKADMYEKKTQAPSSKPDRTNPLKTNKFPIKKIGNISNDMKIAGLLVAAVTGVTTILFMLILASLALWAILLIIAVMLEAPEQLNVHRISKFDSRLRQNIG